MSSPENTTKEIEITTEGVTIIGTLTLDLKCRKTSKDVQYYPVFKILTKPCTLKGNVTLSNELVIGMSLSSLDIEYLEIYESHIGPLVKWEGAVFKEFINDIIAGQKTAIEALIKKGWTLEGFLQWAHLDVLKFASFEDMTITNHEGYVDLEFNPKFNIT